MGDGLCYAKKQQAYSHSGTEQHGEPTQVGVIGLRVIRPQFDVGKTTERQIEHKNKKSGNGSHIKPANISDQPGLDRIKNRVGFFCEDSAEQADGRNKPC